MAAAASATEATAPQQHTLTQRIFEDLAKRQMARWTLALPLHACITRPWTQPLGPPAGPGAAALGRA